MNCRRGVRLHLRYSIQFRRLDLRCWEVGVGTRRQRSFWSYLLALLLLVVARRLMTVLHLVAVVREVTVLHLVLARRLMTVLHLVAVVREEDLLLVTVLLLGAVLLLVAVHRCQFRLSQNQSL